MRCDTDRYFHLEENRLELTGLPGAGLRPISSSFGHCAGAPGRFGAEAARVEAATRELLSTGMA